MRQEARANNPTGPDIDSQFQLPSWVGLIDDLSGVRARNQDTHRIFVRPAGRSDQRLGRTVKLICSCLGPHDTLMTYKVGEIISALVFL